MDEEKAAKDSAYVSPVTTDQSSESDFGFTKKEEARLLRKVDLNILVVLALLFSFSLIDRSNLAIASVAGMSEDMGLEGTNRYSIMSLVYFPPAVLVELPCNVLIRKVGPRYVLSAMGIGWGVIMIGMGFARQWTDLVVCRLLLGFFDGGFFPGCSYLISCWYIRKEVQKRFASFYMTSLGIAGFSPILAYGLSQMDGVQGIHGWRWIFIIEGIITVALGILCLIMVQDFPDKKSRFLTERESSFMLSRIEKDRGDSKADSLAWKALFKHMLDYKLWLYSLMIMCATAASYANGFFVPLILQGMGFNTRDSQLLTTPPFIFAVVMGLFIGWMSDKLFSRSPFIFIQAIAVIVGVIMTAYCEGEIPRYIGAFINVAGAQGNIPAIMAYNANNITSYSKRATATAMLTSFGAIGGIFAVTTYRDQDAPRYIVGTWATVACQFFIILCTCFLTTVFYFENRRQANGTLKKPIENTPGFRYTY